MKLRDIWNKWTIQIAFGLAIVILLGAGFLSYRSVLTTRANQHWVEHTQSVIDNFQQMMITSASIDANVNGFILTGDDSYLASQTPNIARVHAYFDSIRALTSDNDEQQRRLDGLVRAFDQKATAQKALQDVRRANGVGAVADEILRGQGEIADIAFQAAAIQFRAEEMLLLASRNLEASQSVGNSQRIIIAGSILAVLIAGAAGWSLKRDVERRERAERAFRESEEKYLRVIHGVRDHAIFKMTPAGAIRTWTPGAEKMTGYAAADAIGTNFENFFTSDEIKAGQPADILRLAATNGQCTNHGTRLRKDGTRILVHSTYTALYDAERKVIGISVISQDLSENAEAGAKYRGLMEAARDALVVINATGKIVLLNGQAEKQFGYRRDELLGQDVTMIIPQGFAERLAAGGLHPTSGHEAQDPDIGIELTGLRQDGREFPIELMLSPHESADGVLVTAAIRDISTRKAAELHLVAMEGRYRGLLDAAPDAMVVVNNAGRIVLINVQAERQFGYRREELIGQLITKVIPVGFEERRIADGLCASQGALTQIGVEPDLYGKRRDGTDFPIELMLGPLETPDGTLITTVIRDITERKRVEQQLLTNVKELNRSNEELGQFAYIASHDLQEPLRMVASYTQLLARRYAGKLDADADEFIAYAVDGATRMQRLIQDLLTFSRIETKARALCEISSEAAFAQAVINLRGAIEESQAVITHGRLPFVMADESQLLQVFQNLIGNAIKYRGSAPPAVHVSAAMTDAEKWKFAVRDNGLGIDPQYFDKIFGMFQRLHRREEFAGTGIGLAVCKKIVERHGGVISVESQPGEGSTFYFALPAAIGNFDREGQPTLMSA